MDLYTDLYKKKSFFILWHTKRLGRAGVVKLIESFGTAEIAVDAGWNESTRTLFNKWQVGDWESDLERCEREKITLISYQDPSYPKNLLSCPDFPLLLYVKGDIRPADATSLALIGTRNATLYGKQMASGIAKELGENGVCVVSGLARGIDSAAHLGALEGGGRTLAIIGSGLCNIYPKENGSLADKIAENGAVISEYPMNTAPAKGLFPRRNRIVAALALGVCLIESPLEGGGMITMKLAQELKKKLFALPGRVDWPTFAGNHALIKEQKALLIENTHDLLNHLNVAQKEKIAPILTFSPQETVVLIQLEGGEKSIEELVLLTQFPIMQLNVLLTRLLLRKAVLEFPGKVYKSRIDGKSINHR